MSIRRDCDLFFGKLFSTFAVVRKGILNFEQLQEESVSGGTLNIALGGELATAYEQSVWLEVTTDGAGEQRSPAEYRKTSVTVQPDGTK